MMRILSILLGMAALPIAQADGLGRLFFTPEQREQLEYQRTHKIEADNGTISSTVTLNGIVQRSNGSRTVWINGRAQTTSRSKERDVEAHTVSVSGQSNIQIKVGQRVVLEQIASPNSDKTVEQK